MNKAEVVHASWAHRDRSNLSLLDAACMDTRDSLGLEGQLKSFKEGRTISTTGPSFRERNFRRDIDLATRYGREVIELGDSIDNESRHRPPEQRKGKKNTRNSQRKKTADFVQTPSRLNIQSSSHLQSNPLIQSNQQTQRGTK